MPENACYLLLFGREYVWVRTALNDAPEKTQAAKREEIHEKKGLDTLFKEGKARKFIRVSCARDRLVEKERRFLQPAASAAFTNFLV